MKTDVRYLASGGFWLSIGQVIATASALLLAIAFANLLSPETYGTYKFVLSAVGILAIPTLGGLNTSMGQAIARGVEGVFKRGIVTKIRWGLAGTFGSLVLAAYYYMNRNLQLASAFALVAPFIPVFETFGVFLMYLQSKKRFRQSTRYYVLLRLLYVGVLIGVAFATDNVLLVLLAYFGSLTAVNLFFLLRTFKTVPPNTHDETGVLRYGKHLSLVGVIGKVGSYLDSLLLFHFLGPVQVAQYAFARAPVDQIIATYKNFPILALPKFSNRSIEEINQMFMTRLLQATLLSLAIGIAYVAFAPLAFHIVFPKYLTSVGYSQLLAISLVLQLPLTFIGSAVQSKLNDTPPSWLYWRTAPQALYVLSLLILIPFYGIAGAVIGRIFLACSQLCMQSLQWLWFSRGSHLKAR